MNAEEFRTLYEYNAWANRRVMESCARLNADQFTRDLVSSFHSVRDTLAHILGAEWLWLERWHGRSHSSLLFAGDFSDLSAIRARWAEVERDLTDFVASLTDDDVSRVYEYKTTEGVPYASPAWQMLQHVVNHGTYHRGQIATMLRQLGNKSQSTDLILFYRERAAQAKA
jgi:uncharacterized damage-inducible protein DinB